MGRAASGNPGRCRQRGGSPGGRRRREHPRRRPRKRRGPRRRRKACARRRRRARPRRNDPVVPVPGPLLQEPPQASNCAELLGLCASRDDWRCARSMHEFSAKDIDGHMVCLDKYKGYVCIVTNVASQGKTDVNYTQLVDLHARYAECGLRILAFPCNQFGKQEPGSNQEIKEFAAGYNVKFDMYSKICVNGDDAHPLWKWMKIQPKGRGMLGNAIKWNFTKFLIDKNGCVMKRYGPMEEPQVIEKDLPCYL
uniref:Glutathione peroxidase n=1 Tax=Peromyscus maniculatus bairdii TaxID=230844 RepID=A0A8C8UF71_PERMB